MPSLDDVNPEPSPDSADMSYRAPGGVTHIPIKRANSSPSKAGYIHGGDISRLMGRLSELEETIKRIDRNVQSYGSKRRIEFLQLQSLTAEVCNRLPPEEESSSEPGNLGVCIVCMDSPRETVLGRCRHVLMCKACTESLVDRAEGETPTCPVCRKKFKRFASVKLI